MNFTFITRFIYIFFKYSISFGFLIEVRRFKGILFILGRLACLVVRKVNLSYFRAGDGVHRPYTNSLIVLLVL